MSQTEKTPLVSIVNRQSVQDYQSDSAVVGTRFRSMLSKGSNGSDEYYPDSDDHSHKRSLTAQGKNPQLPLSESGIKSFSSPNYHISAPQKTRRNRVNKQFQKRSKTSTLRVSSYCTCDKLGIIALMKWLERVETGQLAGSELNRDGWSHKMYLGALHSICYPSEADPNGNIDLMRQKDVFYFSTGCVVFWGLTRSEEQNHMQAITNFSFAPVKEIQFEDLQFRYGDECRILNDEITLKTTDPNEKLAISFAISTSSKLDVFEHRVEETIKETKHIPEDLASTGSIRYSKTDISKLIGRLFIVRTDVNLNSDLLDEPDFFWEFDEWEPIYSKMMRYLDVEERVAVLNTRLDVLRELLDVLNQQLENQHASHLEWIIIWLILAEVAVQIVWNIFVKDIFGYFPCSSTS